ncbi:olfactory receptor 4B13-like [Leptodactylus fuscus]|uniref:olfactory receptor 4B13-like n=1 Tax=Leptodactylus fuscus TaxID=238119 RepID=UPI003F4E4B06
MTLLQYESNPRMENISTAGSSFVFQGLLEMERYRIPYSIIALGLYIVTTMMGCLIIYVVWVEESLHEPMYIFISNLLLNGVFGSTAIFPRFIFGLLLGSPTISFPECFTQAFCAQSFTGVEIFTFTAMAYDRYLAVGNPLRYPALVTNMTAMKCVYTMWLLVFLFILVTIILTAKLQFCGVNINNIFCDNMSLVRLACGNSSVSNIFGLVESLLFVFIALIIIVYCYIRTLFICLKTSRSKSLKAVHTLVTHIITFSIFLVASFFVFLRYRLSGGNVSVSGHVLFSIAGVLTSIIVNPIVYGIRTEALKVKLIYNLQKIDVYKIFSQQK